MSKTYASLNLAPATKGFSVNNIMRRFSVATRTAIHVAWRDFEREHDIAEVVEDLPIGIVDDGIAYLVSAGLATSDGTTITPTNIGSDGKPARLRRVPGNDFGLEVLPSGATPQDGS
jgi:hypothetical protein